MTGVSGVMRLVLVAALVVLAAPASASAAGLELSNSFVSSTGWVKPGETYPFTLRVRNPGDAPASGTVTVPAPAGATLSDPAGDAASVADGTLTWNVGEVPAGGERTLVVEATADGLAANPEIVWRDLSSTATLGDATARSHGPKVIPPQGGYETARYGDRPFPVVPVDFSDRPHEAGNTAEKLAAKINDPGDPGSTFNL
jgi:hypothetical protein